VSSVQVVPVACRVAFVMTAVESAPRMAMAGRSTGTSSASAISMAMSPIHVGSTSTGNGGP
jgi:hypothetical protein